MYRPIAAACAALALAACATPTVYAPANPNAASSVGFSEYRIENNRYRVTFQGGAGGGNRAIHSSGPFDRILFQEVKRRPCPRFP